MRATPILLLALLVLWCMAKTYSCVEGCNREYGKVSSLRKHRATCHIVKDERAKTSEQRRKAGIDHYTQDAPTQPSRRRTMHVCV